MTLENKTPTNNAPTPSIERPGNGFLDNIICELKKIVEMKKKENKLIKHL